MKSNFEVIRNYDDFLRGMQDFAIFHSFILIFMKTAVWADNCDGSLN